MTRGRSLAACLCLLLLLGVVASPVARADSTAPRITGVGLAAAPAVGYPVTVNITTSDEGEPGSGVARDHITFEKQDANGEPLATVTADGSGQTGWASTVHGLSTWAASGRWVATRAQVSDFAGNETTYLRDGTVTTTGEGATPPPLNLSVLDFTISNANQDIATPVVDRLTPLWRTVHPGDPMAVLASVRDDRSRVVGVYVEYQGPSGETIMLATPNGPGAAGLASAVLPLGVAPGVWTADFIWLLDAANNQHFLMRGSEAFSPAGVRPFTTQSAIDWAGLDVNVVSDAPVDDAPPVLNSFTLVTPSTVRDRDYVEIDYDASDASGVAGVSFVYGASSAGLSVSSSCRTRPKAVTLVPSNLAPGPLPLNFVHLSDPDGHWINYFPDGTTVDERGNVGSHSLDLSPLALTYTTGQGTGAIPSSLITCNDGTSVTTTAPTSALRGSTVSIDGSVTSGGQPVVNRPVVIYRTDLGKPARVSSLTYTDSSGTYHTTLPLNAPTTVRVEFLGGGMAREGLSANKVILWKRGVAVSGPATSGATATFSTRIAPAVAGARMLLQWLTPRGWDTTAIATTDSTGNARFTIHPPIGLRHYRSVAQQTTSWAIAISPTIASRRTS